MGLLRIGCALLLFTQVYGASLPGNLSKKHGELLSKLSNYRLIHPFRSTSDGVFLSQDLTTDQEEEENSKYKIVKRAHNQQRSRRSIDERENVDEYSDDMVEPHDPVFHFVLEGMNGEHLMLNVERNRELVSPNFVVERHTENGTLMKEYPDTSCYYIGHVSHEPNSTVAISNCAGMNGWISTGDEEYIIEPIEVEDPSISSNFSNGGAHILYKISDLEVPEILFDSHGPEDDTMQWIVKRPGANIGEEIRQRQRRQASRAYSTDEPHFIETMIAADWSMQEFHGNDIIEYLTTMINIVNKAYAHESLGVNIKFVIVKIILLNEDQSRNLVIERDAELSLAKVCRWASESTTPDDNSPKHHDFAAFLTRRNFGPDGFAPVTGMCAISKSCSLNRDNGPLTPLVVAHEAGHVLGMRHDGPEENGCKLEDGAIMRPSLRASISYFWSDCSKGKLIRQLPTFDCLRDTSFNTTDDRCRSDLGPDNIPCNGVCIQGRCVDIKNRNDGSWGEWGPWSECTFNCGTGVQTRIRKCDNPPPANGGRDCEGKSLEYKLCNTKPCKKIKDRRATQCHDNLENWVYHGENHQWIPFQNRNGSQQCKLTCMSETTNDVVFSTYNVTDGTPCNYEDKDSICIQGECVNVGCDRRLGSTLATDICGVCGEYVKIIQLPAGATNLKIEEVGSSRHYIALKESANGRYILNGARKQSKAHDFIDQGIRYIYRPNNLETLVTAGPLPVNMQLRVYVKAKTFLIHLKWSYYIREEPALLPSFTSQRENSQNNGQQISNETLWSVIEDVREVPEYPATPEGFLWKGVGWTECTASCGGGVSYFQYQCERTRDNATVNPRRCNKKDYDQLAISKPCNEEECLPEKPHPVYEWRPSEWGPCSKTCGTTGEKTRRLSCQKVRYNDDGSLFDRGETVDLEFCPEDIRPAEVDDCQGRACSADWHIGPWSDCSVTCGSGTQTRTVRCDKPEGREDEFRCFTAKPRVKRPCKQDHCPPIVGCQPMNKDFCNPQHLTHCRWSRYEEYCCTTCEQQRRKLNLGRIK